MRHTTLRGPSTDPPRKCSRCRQAVWDIEIDGVALCEDCLTKAIHATSGDPGAARNYEVRLLAGELARLTGRNYRVNQGLNLLPNEEVVALRRAIRDVEDQKAIANRKLRQFGLPGV